MHIEETFFAARVKAFETTFDQLFFIVDSNQQNMLLGLPAITTAKLRLLTVEGEDFMPNMSKVLSLDIGLDKAVLPEKQQLLSCWIRQWSSTEREQFMRTLHFLAPM